MKRRGVGWQDKYEFLVGRVAQCAVGRSCCLVFCFLPVLPDTHTGLPCVCSVSWKPWVWINLSISCTHSPLPGQMPQPAPDSWAVPPTMLAGGGSGECSTWSCWEGVRSMRGCAGGCLWYGHGLFLGWRGNWDGHWRALLGGKLGVIIQMWLWTRSVRL